MSTVNRERQLLQTFARLADTLVDDYDVVELLQLLVDTCQEMLDFTAAGILLADLRGDLEVIASSSESSRLVEMMQLSAEAGPCIDSFMSGTLVTVRDISVVDDEWKAFRESALAQGFNAVVAVPLRLRDQTIGTLNLLHEHVGEPDPDDVLVARAFADVATIGILHERSLRESETLATQLQSALNSRVVIEQAKGVIAHTSNVPIDEAFSVMRAYARAKNLRLSEVAARVVDRSLRVDR